MASSDARPTPQSTWSSAGAPMLITDVVATHDQAAGPTELTFGDVMTAAEVAALLAVPKSTIEEWARRGVVPSRKRGRRRFYLKWEIYQWLVADDD